MEAEPRLHFENYCPVFKQERLAKVPRSQKNVVVPPGFLRLQP